MIESDTSHHLGDSWESRMNQSGIRVGLPHVQNSDEAMQVPYSKLGVTVRRAPFAPFHHLK